jgi:hypothetical protein
VLLVLVGTRLGAAPKRASVESGWRLRLRWWLLTESCQDSDVTAKVKVESRETAVSAFKHVSMSMLVCV